MTVRALFLPVFGLLELRRWLWWAFVRRLFNHADSRYSYALLAAHTARRELVRLLKEWT